MVLTGITSARRRALHEQAADAIREMIMSGELADGARLIEADLSARFSISRTPLREALRQLEAEGLVVLHPHRGASVAVMTAAETADLFQVLAELEGLAVRLAVPRIDDVAMRALQRLHDRMIRHKAEDRRRECFEVDQAIHQRLIDIAGNAALASVRVLLMHRARRGRYRAFFTQERWDEAMEEHAALIAAIAARDAEGADALMREHVLHTGQTLCRAMTEGAGPTRKTGARA